MQLTRSGLPRPIRRAKPAGFGARRSANLPPN